MTTALRLGVLAIATGAVFVAGSALSELGKRDPGAAPRAARAASESAPPAERAPWAEHGFRDGENCEDVFQNPG